MKQRGIRPRISQQDLAQDRAFWRDLLARRSSSRGLPAHSAGGYRNRHANPARTNGPMVARAYAANTGDAAAKSAGIDLHGPRFPPMLSIVMRRQGAWSWRDR